VEGREEENERKGDGCKGKKKHKPSRRLKTKQKINRTPPRNTTKETRQKGNTMHPDF
jgi:hypothetical protein